MEILLVRHGDAARNAPQNFNAGLNCPDPELTSAGRDHAHQLAQRLCALPIQRIYTSDLRRAVQTAQVLADYLGAPVESRAELREINMGRLFTSTWEEVDREFPGYSALWHLHEEDLPYPGGERGADVIRRVMPLIDEIVEAYRGFRDGRVVIVTHGGTIRSLLCAFLGIGPEKRFLFGAPLFNCGLTVIRSGDETGELTVHTVNDGSHLTCPPTSRQENGGVWAQRAQTPSSGWACGANREKAVRRREDIIQAKSKFALNSV